MRSKEDGWHELDIPAVGPGARYQFGLPDGSAVPDPASRFQPLGVHGASEVVASSTYRWKNLRWAGRPWNGAVIYELHVGTFSPTGTFRGAVEKLEHLVDLGVTAIQLMPIAAFPGERNWGYDGVYPYACSASYGRPDDLKGLVDAAHGHGLMVLLDVVYNHFGPDGNHLSRYAPNFFTERHHTPWGAGINFDGPGSGAVRSFLIDSAVRWVEEFQMDGLRLDAVHAILDDSPVHFLDELASSVRSAVPTREVHLILENEDNDAKRLERDDDGKPKAYSAQWNDDIHHVLHTAVTQESNGYYADYLGNTQMLGRALAEGFAFQGEHMPFRGSPRGNPCRHLPPQAFVAFLQNHDQIGNRAQGERLHELASRDARRAASAVFLLSPQIPMLFMGEEWEAHQPFPFFCDYSGELGRKVSEGRKAEFAHLPEFSGEGASIPEPSSIATFESARLRWEATREPNHSETLQWYRAILGVRRREIIPRLPHWSCHGGKGVVRAPGAVSVSWASPGGLTLQVHANLSGETVDGFPSRQGRSLWIEGTRSGTAIGPWSVVWQLAGE